MDSLCNRSSVANAIELITQVLYINTFSLLYVFVNAYDLFCCIALIVNADINFPCSAR